MVLNQLYAGMLEALASCQPVIQLKGYQPPDNLRRLTVSLYGYTSKYVQTMLMKCLPIRIPAQFKYSNLKHNRQLLSVEQDMRFTALLR